MKKYNQMLYHRGNCLNLKKTYPRECRLCIQTCPHNAISEQKDINLDKCTECGVCMAVCPSDGFVDRDMRQIGAYIQESESCVLNCPMAEPWGYEIACIGMLDKDALTALMLMSGIKNVRILTGDCMTCTDRKASEISRQTIEDIAAQWPDYPKITIEKVPTGQGDAHGQKEPVKKPLLARPKKSIRNTVREFGMEKLRTAFPAIESDDVYAVPKTREWLIETLRRHPDQTMKVPIKVISANNQCSGCGVCTRICPQQALGFRQKGNRKLLVYEPSQCVQCGRCIDICGSRVLRFENRPLTLQFLTGKVLLCEADSYHCSRCGKQIYTNTESELCAACAATESAKEQP
ncbi:4Fe-4S binding protein [Dehalobacter sp. DCM]|uniref:4Fe-4S dicluster domain-containing protein n=1 Tax=Dehalobacter sp. DCM TaxID=2907827 RepID=UPI00308130DB|nr:4Fe-4S binding protein [Dehalobacter sp. DCM]